MFSEFLRDVKKPFLICLIKVSTHFSVLFHLIKSKVTKLQHHKQKQTRQILFSLHSIESNNKQVNQKKQTKRMTVNRAMYTDDFILVGPKGKPIRPKVTKTHSFKGKGNFFLKEDIDLNLNDENKFPPLPKVSSNTSKKLDFPLEKTQQKVKNISKQDRNTRHRDESKVESSDSASMKSSSESTSSCSSDNASKFSESKNEVSLLPVETSGAAGDMVKKEPEVVTCLNNKQIDLSKKASVDIQGVYSFKLQILCSFYKFN